MAGSVDATRCFLDEHIFRTTALRSSSSLAGATAVGTNVPTIAYPRCFSSKSRGKRRGAGDDSLTNDSLRKYCDRKRVNSLRVILELNLGDKAQPEILSVDEAFAKASEYELDIVGVAMNGDTPVVKIVDHNKMLFHSKKQAQERKKDKKVLATKEIKFKAGISTADLERKVGNIISYLVKGHTCQVTVTSAFRRAIQNNAIVEETYDKVHEYLKEYVMDNPQLAGKRQNWRNRSVTFRPKKNIEKIVEKLGGM